LKIFVVEDQPIEGKLVVSLSTRELPVTLAEIVGERGTRGDP
jgi:hypothetical protein